jgi:lipoprotein-anchoring transpeptidase ErfK/SrfK
MTESPGDLRRLLDQARAALGRGDKVAARRLARRAVRLDPHSEAAWLTLAAVSEPRPALAYAARALEINPRSQPARRAIRWAVRQLPPRERPEALREVRLPTSLAVQVVPLEALTSHRLFSLRVAVPALVIVAAVGVWAGSPPADADQPRQEESPVAKASFTPTPTDTPTPTPTPTWTPTPTETPTPTVTPTPTPRPNVSWTYSEDPAELADEGRWIDVDLSEQRVTAYEGDQPVQTFIVSTGTRAHPTVTGQFRVYVKYKAAPMSGPGYYLPGVPYIMYFYSGYALHGTYWHNNFGTPMSHGCINLRTSEAEWLYGFASIGTLVNVHP